LILTGLLAEDTIGMPDKPPPSSLMTRAWNGDRQARGMIADRCGYSSDPETAPDDQLALGEHWLFTADASTRSAIASRWPR
jgi:hypothetical protein